jgi:hypothetical protein
MVPVEVMVISEELEYLRRFRNTLADEVVMVEGEEVPTMLNVKVGPMTPLIVLVEPVPPPEIPSDEVATHVEVVPFVCKT